MKQAAALCHPELAGLIVLAGQNELPSCAAGFRGMEQKCLLVLGAGPCAPCLLGGQKMGSHNEQKIQPTHQLDFDDSFNHTGTPS